MNIIYLNFLKFTCIKSYLFLKKFFSFTKKNKKNYLEEKIKKNGYIIINNFISKDSCKEIIQDINKFIKKYPHYISHDLIKSDLRINGAENIGKKIYKFKKNSQCLETAETIILEKVSCLFTMANKLIFKKKNLGSGGGWHKDSIYSQFKAILYLNDVNNKNGAFQIINNTGDLKGNFKILRILKNNVFNTRFKNSDVIKITKKLNLKINTLIGSAGTLILVDTSNIHRGSPIITGKRYALTNYYYPKKMLKVYDNHFKPILKRKILN